MKNKLLFIHYILIFVILSITSFALDLDNDGYNSTLDCNDLDNQTYLNMSLFTDNDQDTYTIGDQTIICTDGIIPPGYSNTSNGEDCNDNDNTTYTLVSAYADLDNDTYTSGNQLEICTDGTIPPGYLEDQNPEDCNDSESSINPSIEEILYNGIDDDCNMATSDELELSIHISKNNYNIAETVEYTLDGTPDSTISIELASPGNYYNYNANYINQELPITDSLSSTGKIGNYILLGTITKDGYTEEINRSFTVLNSMNANINGDKNILLNETLSLSTEASGGVAPYTYSWNLDDGNTKQGDSITHKYQSADDYEVILTVTDANGNIYTEDVDIDVKAIYTITFSVKDEDTDKPIKNVAITAQDHSVKTGTNGLATMRIPEGSYDFFIYNENYYMETLEKRVKATETINILLSKTDSTAPKIKLSDENIEAEDGKRIIIGFEVTEESPTTCALYTNEDDSEWWNEKISSKDVSINEKDEFVLESIENQEVRYKIECIDDEENSAFSTIGSIKVIQEEEIRNTNKLLVEEIDSILNDIDQLDLHSKEIYERLEIENGLRAARKYISGYEKNIYGAKNNLCVGAACETSEEKIKEKIDNINSILNETLETTIKDIEIIRVDEYIKYPSEESIAKTLEEYFRSNNKTLSKKQLENVIEHNIELQSRQGVFTKTIDARMHYLDGTSHETTIVSKELKLNVTSANQIIIETIPIVEKDEIIIAEDGRFNSVSQIEFNNDITSLTYYFTKSLTNQEKDSIRTLLLDPNIFIKKTPTGFSLFNIKDKTNLRTLIIVGILMIGILIRIAYMFDLNKKIPLLNFSKNKDLTHSMNMLVNDCLDYLDANNFEKAVFVYKEIRLTYEKLPESVKREVYESIINLVKILDEKYINLMIEKREIGKLKELIPTMPADMRNKFLPAINLMNS